jgi:hypothetical protein
MAAAFEHQSVQDSRGFIRVRALGPDLALLTNTLVASSYQARFLQLRQLAKPQGSVKVTEVDCRERSGRERGPEPS